MKMNNVKDLPNLAGLSDISKKGGKLITAKPAIMKKPEVLVAVFYGVNPVSCLRLKYKK